MAKLTRYHEENCPYFVTAVVKDRQPIFTEHDAASLLREVLDACRRRYRFLALSYVIMPDHFHAIIVPSQGDTISSVMRYIKGSFARSYNAEHSLTGAVWQPSFYDQAIRTEAGLAARIRYTEWNPVHAGLVDEPRAYPSSSANSEWQSDLDEFMEGVPGRAEGPAYETRD